MSEYILMRSINEDDVLKYPGATILEWDNGYYIIKIPVLSDTTNKNRFLNLNGGN